MRNPSSKKRSAHPSRIGHWILSRILNGRKHASLTGDIEEISCDIARREGRWASLLWYWNQVGRLMPVALWNCLYCRFVMFPNYIKIAMRAMKKHKVYSFINIAGLSVGMACAIFILLWVQDEHSFDGFHTNKASIFRIASAFHNDGNINYGSQTPATIAPFLKDNYPEILKSTTVCNSWITGNPRNIIKCGEKVFYTDDLILTDPSFFEIFSFSLLKGDKATALTSPNAIILTNSIAERCFGSEDPINKTIQVDGNLKMVTGVTKNAPRNSHLQFDVILPLSYITNTDMGFFLRKWDTYGFSTYVQLQEGVEKNEIDQKIDDLIIRNDPWFGETAAHIFLQPLLKIRLYNVNGSGGLIQYVYIFSTIAFIVLLIACINYMNLSTARSVKRAKEIGLRKVVGSNRTQIIRQFFSESLLYAFLSFLISIIIVILFLPRFNALTGKQIDFNYTNPGLLIGLVGVAVFTGIISGCYPALYLSSFIPIEILNKSKNKGAKTSLFRKTLVVVQFTLSISLIICMIIVSDQVGYMRNAEVGFEKENVLTLPVRGGTENILESFKYELLDNPAILSVSAKSSSPLRSGATSGTISWEGKAPDLQIAWHHPMVDHDYFQTLNMEMVEGRDFSREIGSDLQQGFILNEEAIRQGNIQNPVGKQITVNGSNGAIIGVVKNAQLNSLRFHVRPEVFHLSRTFQEQFQTIFIKLDSGENGRRFGNITASLAHIESVWEKFMPDAPFEYRFLDETLENQYRAELRISGILKSFTFLAVFLSCLGLFGLTLFMVEQRTKEIAVRKTLGAPLFRIVFMLVNQFLIWILIANMVAWPIAYFVMNRWLQDFANRIDVEIITFVFACVLSLFIGVVTVIHQSLKAALANPVDSLRYE
jgi:putative ABC transport system permease protein